MELIADVLLIAGALGAGLYCAVLSRRLSRFTDVEKGVGGAISVLSRQVTDMTKALEMAQAETASSATSLATMTGRAEVVAQRLELLVASMHDLQDAEAQPASPSAQPEAEHNEDEDVVTLFRSRRATATAAE